MARHKHLYLQLLAGEPRAGDSEPERISGKRKPLEGSTLFLLPHWAYPSPKLFAQIGGRALGVPALAMLAVVGGCATRSLEQINYDQNVSNAQAGIMLSDPKVFSRQALVRERQEDVAWIDELIDKSKSEEFAPELLREVEQIKSLAAALGLKVDPALGLDNRRDRQTGDIQQQIDVLKLEFALEQLQEDLELLRNGRAKRTEPINTGLGVVPAGSTPNAGPVPDVTGADQLKGAIDRLTSLLVETLDKESKAPRLSKAEVNPADLFRDRAAYRDLLRSARNAASLDEGHDIDGASLVRLNFQATIVPDPNHSRSLGAIQIQPRLNENSRTASLGFIAQWVEFLNRNTDPTVEAEINSLINAGVVERVTLSAGKDGSCGEILEDGAKPPPNCAAKSLILPVLIGGDGKAVRLFEEAKWSKPYKPNSGGQYPMRLESSLSMLSKMSLDATSLCAVINGAPAGGQQQGLLDDLEYARALQFQAERLKFIFRAALGAGLTPSPSWDIDERLARALELLNETQRKLPSCAEAIAQYKVNADELKFSINTNLQVAAENLEGVRVYNIGPREQVQQVSTVARAAESLALAAQLAASKPGSGAALQAATSFSRQTSKRADARERVPAVVGFANAGNNGRSSENGQESSLSNFGWVIGPLARVDAGRASLTMSQPLRTYDLSVDLSVPSFYDHIELIATSVWGPSPTDLASGNLPGTPRVIQVPLPRVANDFRRFNRKFLGRGANSQVSLNDGQVSACRETVLLATGPDQLWRTNQVLVGDQLLTGSAISVLPDMSGISIRVGKMPDLRPGRVGVTLLNPHGRFFSTVSYAEKPSLGCDSKGDSTTSTAQPGPKITAIEPADATFLVPGDIQFRVTGTNLKEVDGVQLRAWPGTIIEKANDGKTLTVRFSKDSTATFRSSDSEVVKFLVDKKDVAQTTIRLIKED